MTNQQSLENRVAKLEDAVAFADHRHEQLDESLTEVGQRVMALIGRLQRLEARLEGVVDRVGEFDDRGVEAPPHAAGPDISKDPL